MDGKWTFRAACLNYIHSPGHVIDCNCSGHLYVLPVEEEEWVVVRIHILWMRLTNVDVSLKLALIVRTVLSLDGAGITTRRGIHLEFALGFNLDYIKGINSSTHAKRSTMSILLANRLPVFMMTPNWRIFQCPRCNHVSVNLARTKSCSICSTPRVRKQMHVTRYLQWIKFVVQNVAR